MAEENSAAIEQRTRALLEKPRSTLKTDDIEAVEQMVEIWARENKLLRSKRPAEFSSAQARIRGLYRCFETLPRAAGPRQRPKHFSPSLRPAIKRSPYIPLLTLASKPHHP
jgi:hypothetical protein